MFSRAPQKRNVSRSILSLVALSAVAWLALCPPVAAGAASTCPPLTGAQLPPLDEAQRQKLCQETRKLEIDNQRSAGALGDILALAPFLTALAAIATLGLASVKQQADKSRQRKEDRQQRALELQTRFDEQFADAIGNLGSEAAGLQAAGASSLLRLQQRSDTGFQREILLFCAAQLRIGVGDRVRQIVVEVFENALRTVFAVELAPHAAVTLSLEGAKAPRLNLAGVNLKGISVDFTRAELPGATLRQAEIWGLKADSSDISNSDCAKVNLGPAVLNNVNCRRTRFSGARLSSSKWRNADVSGATFIGAKLQSADFRGAVLQGVNFNHADLNDAYFDGAVVDLATIQTIVKANNWRKAHFDPRQRASIDDFLLDGQHAGQVGDTR